MLPQLAAAAKHENWGGFTRQLSGAMQVIALITVPTAFFSVITSDHIITLLFKVNKFDEHSVALTSYAFRFHMIGLFFIALNRIIAPAFYAQKNAKSPTIAGIASFAINIALALMLVSPMKGGGIALALSLSSAANTVILLAMLRKNRNVDLKGIVRATLAYTVKITAFSIVAVAPVALIARPLYGFFAGSGSRLISTGIPLLIQTLVFAVLGIACLALSKDGQLAYLISMVKRKSRR